jgi:outer membrane protein assembly factor BamB
MKRNILVAILCGLILLVPYALWRDVRLFAINAETGRVVWSESLPHDDDKKWTSRPQVEGLRVFVWVETDRHSYAQQLFAFNSLTGKPLWNYQPKGEVSASQQVYEFYSRPLNIGGDIGVYQNQAKGEFVAIDLDTGAERWRVATTNVENYILSNPALDKVIAVEIVPKDGNSTATLKVYTLSGDLLWSVPTTAYAPRFTKNNIIGDDKVIYIGQSSIYKLNSKNGDIIFKTEINAEGGFSLHDQVLYGTFGSRLSAADASTGKILWHYDEPSLRGLLQSPVVSDKIYLTNSAAFNSSDSWLLAISKEGREIWRKAISTSDNDTLIAFAQMPALISGGVVVIGEDALLAFDDKGNERWRFPMNSQSKSAVSKDKLVYVTAGAPRYRHWLAYINPLWH